MLYNGILPCKECVKSEPPEILQQRSTFLHTVVETLKPHRELPHDCFCLTHLQADHYRTLGDVRQITSGLCLMLRIVGS